MTVTLSIKKLIRGLLFSAVFVGVTSVALLVDARTIPAPPSHGVTVTVETFESTPAANNVQAMFEMADVPDGVASWYGGQFHGRRTASGRRYDMHEYTAAHRSLPFGSLVFVENASNGRGIMVEITDRGPFVGRRVIDLSYAAAQDLGVSVTPVRLSALTPTAIRNFYVDNDTTVLVIDEDQNILVRNVNEVQTSVDAPTHFSDALRNRESGEELVIRPTDDGITYQRVRPTSDLATN